MQYNFYNSLSHEEKLKYNRMLETHYVLSRCDECGFIETDENGQKSFSSSFMLSIQQAKILWRMDPSNYPQGSVSANRHSYEAIRNYLGGCYPPEHEFNLLRQGLVNFIRLRRDDSSNTRSFLFGSSYQILSTKSGRDTRKYRSVEVSLRHTATALWILLEDSRLMKFNQLLRQSVDSFLNRARHFTEKNDDWKNDIFKHLTLAAISKTCDSIIKNFPAEKEASDTAAVIKKNAFDIIFTEDCCDQSLDGGILWMMPDRENQGIAVYEFFLDLFALTMIPRFLKEQSVQLVVRAIVGNKVFSGHGHGIPIHPIITHGKIENIYPDFGASSALSYILWYCLEHNIGDQNWQDYCKEQFIWLLKFCLSSYDKEQYYLLPYTENNSKILFMPRFDHNSQRAKEVEDFISKIKTEIYTELTAKTGKLARTLSVVACPAGLEHVCTLISRP